MPFGARRFRARTAKKLQRQLGCDSEVAFLGAVAIHPFDNGVRPSDPLYTSVKPRSAELAKQARSITNASALESLSVTALRQYLSAATVGDSYYTQLWDSALGGDFAPAGLGTTTTKARRKRSYYVVMDGLGGAPRITRFPATAKQGRKILGPFESKEKAKQAGHREETGRYSSF